MLLLLPLQFLDTQQGLLAIAFWKGDLEGTLHCNLTAKDAFSVTVTIDLLPKARSEEFLKRHYVYPDLPTEGPGFTDPLPEGYEPEATHCRTSWTWVASGS
jgi:hypothetical protein